MVSTNTTVHSACVSFIIRPRKEKRKLAEKNEENEETTSSTDKSIFVTQVGGKAKERKVSYETSDSDRMDETGGGGRKKSERETFSSEQPGSREKVFLRH